MTGKCFALGKYLCTVRFRVPTGVPSTRATSLQSETVSAEPRLWKRLWAGGMAVFFQESGCSSGHLISMAGLLCRLSCVGHVTKASGLVSFSLLPVLPQNTLSNS